MKILSIVSNGKGRTVQYAVNGKGKSQTFPLNTSKKDIVKALEAKEAGKPINNTANNNSGIDSEINALREEAKALKVKGWHFMKNKETLLAKIAEAKAGNDNK